MPVDDSETQPKTELEVESSTGSQSKSDMSINFTDPSDEEPEDEEDVYEILDGVENILDKSDDVAQNDRSQKSSQEKAWEQFGLFFLDKKDRNSQSRSRPGSPETNDIPSSESIYESKREGEIKNLISTGVSGAEKVEVGSKAGDIDKSFETTLTGEDHQYDDESIESKTSEKLELNLLRSSSTSSSKPMARRTGTFKPSPERLMQLRRELGADMISSNPLAEKLPPIKITLKLQNENHKLENDGTQNTNIEKGAVSCCKQKKKKDSKLKCEKCEKLMHASCQNLTKSQVSDILEKKRTFTCTDCLLDSVVCSRNRSPDQSYFAPHGASWRNSEESGLKNSTLVSETGFVGCQLEVQRVELESERRLRRQCEDQEKRYEEIRKRSTLFRKPNGYFWLSEVRPSSPTRTAEASNTDAEMSCEDVIGSQSQNEDEGITSYGRQENGELAENREWIAPKKKLQTARRRKIKKPKQEEAFQSFNKDVDQSIGDQMPECSSDEKLKSSESQIVEKTTELEEHKTVPRAKTKSESHSYKSEDDVPSSADETKLSSEMDADVRPKKAKNSSIVASMTGIVPSTKSNRKRTTSSSLNVATQRSGTPKVEANLPLKEPTEEYRRRAFFKISNKVNAANVVSEIKDEGQLKNFILKVEREIFRFSLRSGHGDNRALTDRYESKLLEVCNKLSDFEIAKNSYKGKIKIVNLVKKPVHDLVENKKTPKLSKESTLNHGNLFDSFSDQKISKILKKEKEPNEKDYPQTVKLEASQSLLTASSGCQIEDSKIAWKGKLVHDQTIVDVVAFRVNESHGEAIDLPEQIKLAKLLPMSEFWRLIESLSRNALLNNQLTVFQMKSTRNIIEYTLFCQKLESLQLHGSARSVSGKSTVYIAPITKHDTKKPLINGFSIDVSVPKSEIALFCFVVLNSAMKTIKQEPIETKIDVPFLAGSLETDLVLDAIASDIDKKKMETFERLKYPDINGPPPPLLAVRSEPGPSYKPRLSNTSEPDFNFEGFPELPEDDGNDFPSDVVFEPPVSLTPDHEGDMGSTFDEFEVDSIVDEESPEDHRILPYFSPVGEGPKSCDQLMPLSSSIASVSPKTEPEDGHKIESIVPSLKAEATVASLKTETKPEIPDFALFPQEIPVDLAPDGIVPMDPRNAGRLYVNGMSEVELLLTGFKRDNFVTSKHAKFKLEPDEPLDSKETVLRDFGSVPVKIDQQSEKHEIENCRSYEPSNHKVPNEISKNLCLNLEQGSQRLSSDISKRISPADEWDNQVPINCPTQEIQIDYKIKPPGFDSQAYEEHDGQRSMNYQPEYGDRSTYEYERANAGQHRLSGPEMYPRFPAGPRGMPLRSMLVPLKRDEIRPIRPLIPHLMAQRHHSPQTMCNQMGFTPRPPHFLPGFPHRVGVRVYRKKIISPPSAPQQFPRPARPRMFNTRLRAQSSCPTFHPESNEYEVRNQPVTQYSVPEYSSYRPNSSVIPPPLLRPDEAPPNGMSTRTSQPGYSLPAQQEIEMPDHPETYSQSYHSYSNATQAVHDEKIKLTSPKCASQTGDSFSILDVKNYRQHFSETRHPKRFCEDLPQPEEPKMVNQGENVCFSDTKETEKYLNNSHREEIAKPVQENCKIGQNVEGLEIEHQVPALPIHQNIENKCEAEQIPDLMQISPTLPVGGFYNPSPSFVPPIESFGTTGASQCNSRDFVPPNEMYGTAVAFRSNSPAFVAPKESFVPARAFRSSSPGFVPPDENYAPAGPYRSNSTGFFPPNENNVTAGAYRSNSIGFVPPNENFVTAGSFGVCSPGFVPPNENCVPAGAFQHTSSNFSPPNENLGTSGAFRGNAPGFIPPNGNFVSENFNAAPPCNLANEFSTSEGGNSRSSRGKHYSRGHEKSHVDNRNWQQNYNVQASSYKQSESSYNERGKNNHGYYKSTKNFKEASYNYDTKYNNENRKQHHENAPSRDSGFDSYEVKSSRGHNFDSHVPGSSNNMNQHGKSHGSSSNRRQNSTSKLRSWRDLSPGSEGEFDEAPRLPKRSKSGYRDEGLPNYENEINDEDGEDNDSFDEILRSKRKGRRHHSDWYDEDEFSRRSSKKDWSSCEQSEASSEKKAKRREKSIDSRSSSMGSWTSRHNDTVLETTMGSSKSCIPKPGATPKKDVALPIETFITAKKMKHKRSSKPERESSITEKSGKIDINKLSKQEGHVPKKVVDPDDLEDGECSD